jgi:hypothetical protein
MPRFNFNDDKVTVVRTEEGGAGKWYHLSKGQANWYLRRHGTKTRYQPGLLDLAEDARVVREMTLSEVAQATGYRAGDLSVEKASEEWDRILDALETPAHDSVGHGPPPVGPAVEDGLGGGHGAERIIPVTDMRCLYMVLQDFTSAEFHLSMAREAERAPVAKKLAERFRESVEQFSDYCNPHEPFYPARHELDNPGQVREIDGTYTLTGVLVHQHGGIGEVENDPGLNFRYVDREIVPTRTTGRARFADGRSAICGKRLDWFLQNSTDRRPIVAEVKVGNDKNPFYALIQTLMYAAELVTFNQTTRLTNHYPQLQFPEVTNEGIPALDIYLVLYNYNWRSDVRTGIIEVTERLCESLMEEPAITSHIRRIACLECSMKEERLHFTRLFRFDRAEP